MKILVYGAIPRQPNLGVEALARGAAAVLHRAFPGSDVRFRFTGPEGDGPMNLGHTAPLVKEMVVDRRGLRAWTRSFDLVCDIRGGDSFADIYTVKRLFKFSAFPLYAQAMKVPVVMLPQTIGPFVRRRSRLLARRLLRGCALVMARDPQSARVARELGRPVDVTSTDVVFAIDRPEPQDRRHDVVLNVSGLLWDENPHVEAAEYRAAVHGVIDRLLAAGRGVTLLAHVIGSDEQPGDNDRAPLPALRAAYGDRLTHLVPSGLDEVRQEMAASRVVVGARMHACLNALSVGVPAVPMAYSRKFAPLLDDLGWRHTVDLGQPGEAVASQVLEALAQVESSSVQDVLDAAHARVQATVDALRALPLTRP